jgi:hypothetical protein
LFLPSGRSDNAMDRDLMMLRPGHSARGHPVQVAVEEVYV